MSKKYEGNELNLRYSKPPEIPRVVPARVPGEGLKEEKEAEFFFEEKMATRDKLCISLLSIHDVFNATIS